VSEHEINQRRCIAYLAKECTEEERITFEIDLLFDEVLKSEYETCSLLWRIYPTNKELWNQSKQQATTRTQRSIYYGRVACAILALIGSLTTSFLLFQSPVGVPQTDYRIYTNVEGSRKKITLEDGSVVLLNGQARLQFTQNDSLRLAWLEGEAFFDVVKNVKKKFLVKHEDLEVEVVGTQFSVNTWGQEKQVALLSGKVLAKLGNGEQLYLKPNEQLLWNTTLGEVKRLKTDVDQQLSWRKQQLIFDNTPLAQALEEINQFYGVSFVIHDRVLAQKRITGVFDQPTVEAFIQALTFIASCSITSTNNHYLIEPYAPYSLSEKQP